MAFLPAHSLTARIAPAGYHQRMNAAALLERDGLLAGLAQHASVAFDHAGSGRVVFVGGEAGVGKSALVRAFLATMPADVTVLMGACESLSTERPLGPLLDFAQRVGTEFAELVQAGEERQRIFTSLLDAVRTGARPHVVVLEDLHWADDATLDLLRYLGRRFADCRALLVGTYRDDEVGTGHPLRRALGDLAGTASVQRLSVAPLSPLGVAALAAGRDVDAEALHRRTGGNPFFVTEVLAAPDAGLPAKVEDAVMARAARLGSDARAALDVAAVLGLVQDLDMFERLVPSPAAIDECVRFGMLTVDERGTRFRHELARDAVLSGLTPMQRRHVHAAIVAALETRFAAGSHGAEGGDDTGMPPESLAVLAHHADGAGDAARVLRYAVAAGRFAAGLNAFREARAQFARALVHADRLDRPALADLYEAYAKASSATSHTEDALAARERYLELVQGGDDPARAALAMAALAKALWDVGRTHEADEQVDRACQAVAVLPESQAHAVVYGVMASLRMLDRDAPAAAHWARLAIESGTRTGNALEVLNASIALVGVQSVTERVAAARRTLRECERLIDLQRPLHDAMSRSSVNSMIGSGLGEVYRFCVAEGHLRLAVEFGSQVDHDANSHYALAWQSLCQLFLGRWDEAGEAALWLLARPNARLITRIMAAIAVGRLRVRRGDPEVWPVLDAALEWSLETDSLQRLAPVRAARAEAALAAGRPDQAVSEVDAVLHRALAIRHRWFVGELLYWRWKAGEDVTVPDWLDGPYAAQIAGDAVRAAHRWRRMGCTYEEARAWVEAGGVDALWRAHDLYSGLGAGPAAAEVAGALRQHGVRGVPRGPRPATAEDAAGLTPRERQVLASLVEGLKNSEIADRNGVSRRTVENQVAAVLAKLEVRTRTAAVSEALRRGLVEPDGLDAGKDGSSASQRR